MAVISEGDAIFVGTVVEGVFFGFLVVLYGIFRYVRAKHRSGRDYFTGTITLLFFLCTLYFAIDLCQQYLTLLEDVAQPFTAYKLNLAASVLYSVIDVISQMILIYRCYLIWGRNLLVVALPFLMSVAALGGEFALVGLLGSVQPGGAAAIIDRLIPTGNAAFSLSLATNTITTALIVFRILRISREIDPLAGGRHLRPAVAMIIESGMFTFIVQLMWVVFFSLNRHPGFYLIGGFTTMTYGITPTVLALRISMGSAYDSTLKERTTMTANASQLEATGESDSVTDEKH